MVRILPSTHKVDKKSKTYFLFAKLCGQGMLRETRLYHPVSIFGVRIHPVPERTVILHGGFILLCTRLAHCYTDIKDLVCKLLYFQSFADKECSGRTECQIPVGHLVYKWAPCPRELSSYLEASNTYLHG